jgi:hypothetical protein
MRRSRSKALDGRALEIHAVQDGYESWQNTKMRQSERTKTKDFYDFLRQDTCSGKWNRKHLLKTCRTRGKFENTPISMKETERLFEDVLLQKMLKHTETPTEMGEPGTGTILNRQNDFLIPGLMISSSSLALIKTAGTNATHLVPSGFIPAGK